MCPKLVCRGAVARSQDKVGMTGVTAVVPGVVERSHHGALGTYSPRPNDPITLPKEMYTAATLLLQSELQSTPPMVVMCFSALCYVCD